MWTRLNCLGLSLNSDTCWILKATRRKWRNLAGFIHSDKHQTSHECSCFHNHVIIMCWLNEAEVYLSINTNISKIICLWLIQSVRYTISTSIFFCKDVLVKTWNENEFWWGTHQSSGIYQFLLGGVKGFTQFYWEREDFYHGGAKAIRSPRPAILLRTTVFHSVLIRQESIWM